MGRLNALFVGVLSVSDVALTSVLFVVLEDLYLKFSGGYKVTTSSSMVVVGNSNLDGGVAEGVSIGGTYRRSLVNSAMTEVINHRQHLLVEQTRKGTSPD